MIILFLFLGLALVTIGTSTFRLKELTLLKNAYRYTLIISIFKAFHGDEVPKYKFTGFVKNIISVLLILGGIAFIYEAYTIYRTGIYPI